MSKSDDITIRPAVDADIPAIVALMERSLKEATLGFNDAAWRWKHVDNPFGRSPVLVATDDGGGGQIVGLRAFMRWTWRADGQDVPAVRAVDTATHPEYQGCGIFKRLTLRLLDDLEADGSAAFVLNTPNSKSKPGYLKMGWSEVARFPVAIRPKRPVRILRGVGFSSPSGPSGAADGGMNPTLRASDTEGLAVEGLAAALERVTSPPRRLHTRRTLAYLRWRYADIPGLPYAIDAETKGEAGAVVVSRLNQMRGLVELRVCELLHTPDAEGKRLAKRLLRDRLRRQPHDFASLMPGPGEGWAALRRGFVTVPRSGLTLTARPIGKTAIKPDPLRLESWALSTGDVELF